MNKIKSYLVLISALFLSFFSLNFLPPGSIWEQLENMAAVFFAERVSPEKLMERFSNRELKILIVPGHEPDFGGTEFGNIKERDLTATLANYLYDELSNDSDFLEIRTTRDASGQYSSWFSDFMTERRDDILKFRESAAATMSGAFDSDDVKRMVNVAHNVASKESSFVLYGVNKYANDNNFDITLHLHFNDYSRHNRYLPGEYRGFSIYIPESQLPNSRASKSLAEVIKKSLSNILPVSNLAVESDVIIESQDLIAIGSNASRDGASVLIEYSYIYEPQIRSSEIRDKFLEELAHQTYLAIKDYFRPGLSFDEKRVVLPYSWNQNFGYGEKESLDVFALQSALNLAGLYPAAGKTLYDCPINGNFGPCTKSAAIRFQEEYRGEILEPLGLLSANGFVGPYSRAKLNQLFGR